MITLKTLPQATEQEVFEQVARHLLIQNARSMSEHSDGSCAYRGVDRKTGKSLKCAAGCLIADDEYLPEMDPHPASESIGIGWRAMHEKGMVPSEHVELIQSLQLLHDNTSVEDWSEALKKMADDWGLDGKFIDQMQ